ncbi:hypothetical protein FOZ62_004370 [Perkinsus olseni]|uniref:Uncharacterized protein n=1 Tax=Perkinsus olseni TaxID=32597 RepID=A0A7J6QIW9_PEROL|nr:hypothetical protein FOZ62_004370 [Perkinsus olseni]
MPLRQLSFTRLWGYLPLQWEYLSGPVTTYLHLPARILRQLHHYIPPQSLSTRQLPPGVDDDVFHSPRIPHNDDFGHNYADLSYHPYIFDTVIDYSATGHGHPQQPRSSNCPYTPTTCHTSTSSTFPKQQLLSLCSTCSQSKVCSANFCRSSAANVVVTQNSMYSAYPRSVCTKQECWPSGQYLPVITVFHAAIQLIHQHVLMIQRQCANGATFGSAVQARLLVDARQGPRTV